MGSSLYGAIQTIYGLHTNYVWPPFKSTVWTKNQCYWLLATLDPFKVHTDQLKILDPHSTN
jgi:hypothetical protein